MASLAVEFRNKVDKFGHRSRRAYTAFLIGMVIATVLHLGLVLYFGILKIDLLMWFNVASAAMYFGLSLYLWSTPVFIAMAVAVPAALEVALHQVLAVEVLGPESGFQFYLLLQITVIAFVASRSFRNYKWIVCTLLGAIFLLIQTTHLGIANHVSLGQPHTSVLFIVNVSLIIFCILLVSSSFTRTLEQTEMQLKKERERSESLLLNILPAPISTRLKSGEQPIADGHPAVSVLFADLVQFTVLSKNMQPDQVVSMLDELFRSFDVEAQRLGVEKIKTIGDCYMAVAGLPEACDDHADRAVQLGLSILQCVENYNRAHGSELQIRVGINSGEVVAGVIGRHKYIYDLWGDAVNTASRMESHGTENAITLSETTKNYLKTSFALVDNGVQEIKGKGPMRTWLIKASA